MLRKQSVERFHHARHDGSLVTYVKPFPNYDLYRYFPDRYAEDKAKEAANLHQHKLNVTNAGKPLSL